MSISQIISLKIKSEKHRVEIFINRQNLMEFLEKWEFLFAKNMIDEDLAATNASLYPQPLFDYLTNPNGI
jgi:hypothetical protein